MTAFASEAGNWDYVQLGIFQRITQSGLFRCVGNSYDALAWCDAVAPALALGYGIGRLGCQFSGDGDWGKPSMMELKPDWLPDWFWAQTYSNNVLQVDIPSPVVS